MQVIDVDGHVFEPDELWERHLDRRFHDRRPRLVRDERGTTRYLIEGRMTPPGTGRGAWVPEGMREASVHREGAVDPRLRLEDMDTDGIDVAVLYGAISLSFATNVAERELAVACCRAYNDWLAEYCQADPARLKGVPALPLTWMADALAEAERAVRELGFVSLTTPCAVGDRNADHSDNDDLYDLAVDLGVPIGFHAGGARFAYHKFVDAYAQLHALEFPFNIMFVATTLVCGGVLERHPRLRVALLEAGAGWVPYFFERLDEHWEHRSGEMPISRAPSSFLHEGRLFISTEGEDGLGHVVDQVGSDCLVWASDYPHWDARFPGAVAAVSERDDISEADRAAILSHNAARMLGWAEEPVATGGGAGRAGR
jgi:predicted TIM-barrel fold metal-dependent hydrolase